MREGLLNLNAYAKQIHHQVEELTMKDVQLGTIVVALSRISNEIKKQESIQPPVMLNGLSVVSPLCDITYEKTVTTSALAHSLPHRTDKSAKEVLIVTESVSEVTIIASERYRNEIKEHMSASEKAEFSNLSGILVSFSGHYTAVPNTLYSLFSALAIHRINIIEVVSTYSELLFVVETEKMNQVIESFQPLLGLYLE